MCVYNKLILSRIHKVYEIEKENKLTVNLSVCTDEDVNRGLPVSSIMSSPVLMNI